MSGFPKMTSRERVLATVKGAPVDRIASHFRAEPEVFEALRGRLGLADDEAVRRWAKSDIRDLSGICNTGGYGGYSLFGWRDRDCGDGEQEDFWGVRRRRVAYDGGAYVEISRFPLSGAAPEQVLDYRFPDPRKIFDFGSLPERIQSLNRGAQRYFILMEGESLFDRCWALRGMEDFMMDLIDGNEAAEHLVEGNFRFFMEFTRMILEAGKGEAAVDAIGLYNDLGTQGGAMISPAIYRKHFKERQRRLAAMIHGFGAKVFYHSCGNLLPMLPDLLEIGIDILDPLQLNAMKLSPSRLRELAGNEVTLHGGLDTQGLLVNGSPDDVRREAETLKRELGRAGRYILSCSHYLQPDVPIANIQAVVGAIG